MVENKKGIFVDSVIQNKIKKAPEGYIINFAKCAIIPIETISENWTEIALEDLNLSA